MSYVTRIYNDQSQYLTVEQADSDLAYFQENYSMDLEWRFYRGAVTLEVKWCNKPWAIYLTHF